MKFYQTIALVMLVIMCTTTIIFGSEVDIRGLKISLDICNEIDGFRGKNDGSFKETGYLKCYSNLLKTAEELIYVVPTVAVFYLTFLKASPKIGFNLAVISAGFLAIVSAIITIFRIQMSPFALNKRVSMRFNRYS